MIQAFLSNQITNSAKDWETVPHRGGTTTRNRIQYILHFGQEIVIAIPHMADSDSGRAFPTAMN